MNTDFVKTVAGFLDENSIPPEDKDSKIMLPFARDCYSMGRLMIVLIAPFLENKSKKSSTPLFKWDEIHQLALDMIHVNPLKRPDITQVLLSDCLSDNNFIFITEKFLKVIRKLTSEEKTENFRFIYYSMFLF